MHRQGDGFQPGSVVPATHYPLWVVKRAFWCYDWCFNSDGRKCLHWVVYPLLMLLMELLWVTGVRNRLSDNDISLWHSGGKHWYCSHFARKDSHYGLYDSWMIATSHSYCDEHCDCPLFTIVIEQVIEYIKGPQQLYCYKYLDLEHSTT